MNHLVPVSEIATKWVQANHTLEKIREIDEPVTTVGVGICNELVVVQWQAENLPPYRMSIHWTWRMSDIIPCTYIWDHHNDASIILPLARHIGVESMERLHLANWRPFMDGALGVKISAEASTMRGPIARLALVHSTQAMALANRTVEEDFRL